MTWQEPGRLFLLWILPLLGLVFAYAAWQRRRALGRFAEAKLLPLLNRSVHGTRHNVARRGWKAVLLILAFGSMVVAVARPGWDVIPQDVDRRGRDVVFVLDVSRSMLAEDLAPNRLSRAALAIQDCVERLQGDRVGLVLFAGNAVVKCPLTLDYGFFRLMAEDITPESVSRGGTLIGDALRKCLSDVFDNREREYRDIVLITDGEDHDSFPVEAAAAVGKEGIRLIAIGLGDEGQGKRIPMSDGRFLKHKGQEVWSRLDANTLRKMVLATPGGRYLNVATGAVDLGEVYTQLIGSAQKKDLGSHTVQKVKEKFQFFLALAFLLLSLELVLTDKKKVLSLLLLFLMTPPVFARSVGGFVRDGNKAFRAGKYDEALAAYEKAGVKFNQGVAHYKKGDYGSAGRLFEESGQDTDDIFLKAKSAYNQGNCLFREAEPMGEDPAKKIETLKKAIAHYQRAWRLSPRLTDAIHNTEVARLAMTQAQEELKKCPQKKPGDEQKKSEKSDSGDPGKKAPPQNKADPPLSKDEQKTKPHNKTAQEILRQEKTDRRKRALRLSVEAISVEKDW
jgi:Ca-activated chloride channel family protein